MSRGRNIAVASAIALIGVPVATVIASTVCRGAAFYAAKIVRPATVKASELGIEPSHTRRSAGKITRSRAQRFVRRKPREGTAWSTGRKTRREAGRRGARTKSRGWTGEHGRRPWRRSELRKRCVGCAENRGDQYRRRDGEKMFCRHCALPCSELWLSGTRRYRCDGRRSQCRHGL
jgi:hypothetical protein